MNKIDIKSKTKLLNIIMAEKKVALNMYFNNIFYVGEALFLLTFKIW